MRTCVDGNEIGPGVQGRRRVRGREPRSPPIASRLTGGLGWSGPAGRPAGAMPRGDLMSNAIFPLAAPVNEPVRSYAPGSAEKKSLKQRLDEMASAEIEIPLVIGGREVRTGDTAKAVCPHDHGHVLATYHQAGAAEVAAAAEAAKKAWREWSELPWEERLSVFLRAADLLAGPSRDSVNAGTMLNQSKTVFQAEIDSACELADFWRWNPFYARQIYAEQPSSPPLTWNRVEYRPLEGFVFAVTPFNFTSIGGNLPTAPALMGNTA